MFKKVVFILDDENAIDKIEELTYELASYGVIFSIISTLVKNVDSYDINDINDIIDTNDINDIIDTNDINETNDVNGINDINDILYITDNPFYYKRIKINKLPVIVYLHDGNREANFPYAEFAIEKIEEIEFESLKLAYLRLTGQPWTILETDRCIIRESTTDDVDSFYEIYKDPSITKYMENLYEDRAEEVEYIKDYIKKVYAFYGYGMWTVLEKRSQEVIGRAGINWREGYDIPELGFVIAVPFQRQGYAYEICQAIINYSQKELGFSSFQVFIMEGNEISKALCRKLGFVLHEKIKIDGAWYDRMIFHYDNQ